jgi:hypothetical protein
MADCRRKLEKEEQLAGSPKEGLAIAGPFASCWFAIQLTFLSPQSVSYRRPVRRD